MKFNQYDSFGDLSRFPVLTREQEHTLGTAMVAGRIAKEQLATATKFSARERKSLELAVKRGAEARQQFITCNVKLAIKIASPRRPVGMTRDDLIQEAILGMQHAVDKFDPEKGFKFSTYATWWIKQALQRATQKYSRTIALPEDVFQEVNALWRAENELLAQFGEPPSEAMLADEMNISIDRVRQLRRWSMDTYSLDAPLDSADGAVTLQDIYVDSDAEDFTELHVTSFEAQMVADELAKALSVTEREVVMEHLGLASGQGASLESVAKRKGMTRNQARWVEQKGFNAVRNAPQIRELGEVF